MIRLGYRTRKSSSNENRKNSSNKDSGSLLLNKFRIEKNKVFNLNKIIHNQMNTNNMMKTSLKLYNKGQNPMAIELEVQMNRIISSFVKFTNLKKPKPKI